MKYKNSIYGGNKMEDKKNVISFMNMKGGVAKSTLCANIGYTLSKEFNQKILLIDMDPQFNLTSLLIDTKTYKNEIFGKKDISLLFDVVKPSAAKTQEKIIKTDIIRKINDKLDIIPGSLDLISINEGEESNYKLRTFIKENKLKETYDYIFIDCPPTKGIYLTIAFYASDYYIIPVKPDYLSTIGIELFKTTIKEKNKPDIHRIRDLGIVFTMVSENINHHEETMKKIKADYEYTVFKNKLHHSYKIPENAEKGLMIYDFKTKDLLIHKHDIIELSNEFLKRIKEKNK